MRELLQRNYKNYNVLEPLEAGKCKRSWVYDLLTNFIVLGDRLPLRQIFVVPCSGLYWFPLPVCLPLQLFFVTVYCKGVFLWFRSFIF